MRKATPSIAAVLIIALLSFAASAGAEEIVPPGNSAAAQYTEAFPSPGGERETEGRKQGKAVPADVIGARDSHRLESKGKDGKAVAEFAAETAPAPVSQPAEQSGGEPPSDEGGESQQTGGGGVGGGGSGSDSGSGGPATDRAGGGSAGSPAGSSEPGNGVDQPSGSSGFGEVVGQMTGSSSGELGLWLPLIVIGAIVWALLYLWRQRQRVI